MIKTKAMLCISLPSSRLQLHSPSKTTFKLACQHLQAPLGCIPPFWPPNLHRPCNMYLYVADHDVPTGSLRSLRRIHQPPSKFRLKGQNATAATAKLHLYVSLPCPWAHRTLIVRVLKGLEEAVPVSVTAYGFDGSWEFKDIPDKDKSMDNDIPAATMDKVNGCRNLKEVYMLSKGGYDGRATVPMLWDVDNKEVVYNES
ncbi:Ribosomal protein L14p/L23e family protein [Hibiscus syriacus]|uniref:Ribosomal protein L14p/L23e family protein n=1 Tax=Hibiscus syriacus TaxID=106335 RepID=A0A6A2WPB2_HIBSY|nr:Ribosomal protein L14p/L23e family protein [Hibiscus syriacus]